MGWGAGAGWRGMDCRPRRSRGLAAGGGQAVGLVLRLLCCLLCGAGRFLRSAGLLFELGLRGFLGFGGGHDARRGRT